MSNSSTNPNSGRAHLTLSGSTRSLPPPKPIRRVSSDAPDVTTRAERTASTSARTFPTIRLSEEPHHVIIVAIVPGFAAEDLDVAVENDVLRLTGRLRRQAPPNLPLVKKERHATDFSRTIKLASDVLRSQTEASLERGVLTVRMRKCGPNDRVPIQFRQP